MKATTDLHTNDQLTQHAEALLAYNDGVDHVHQTAETLATTNEAEGDLLGALGELCDALQTVIDAFLDTSPLSAEDGAETGS